MKENEGTKPDDSNKLRSRIEGAISIFYVLSFVLLLEGISWLFGDVIDANLGRKAGAFTLFVIFPLSLVFSAIVTFVSAYFLIAWAYGKEMAERVLFRWRR